MDEEEEGNQLNNLANSPQSVRNVFNFFQQRNVSLQEREIFLLEQLLVREAQIVELRDDRQKNVADCHSLGDMLVERVGEYKRKLKHKDKKIDEK